jgi:hypothetical protein
MEEGLNPVLYTRQTYANFPSLNTDGGTEVEHAPQHPKVKGSSLACDEDKNGCDRLTHKP